MAQHLFKLPDVGEGIAESEIAEWRVAIGDLITEDQPLVDMLTEKAAVEIPSPVGGRVVELRGNAGDRIAVGAVLVVIDTDASADTAAVIAATDAVVDAELTPPRDASVAPSAMPQATIAAPVNDAGRAQTSPAIRKLARELGIDLQRIKGSGPRGRVIREDVKAAASVATKSASAPLAAASAAIESMPIIGMRRRIAEAMQRSAQRIPHFSYVEEVDVTELEALRLHLNDAQGSARGKLTLLPFLMQAIVRLRARFPQINANYDDEANVLHRHTAVHVGIATQTPQGLMVPVVRDAQTRDLWQAGAAIRRLADAARAGKAKREELSGSTITITSLGAMGGIASTPIINAPEVAIVGVNKMVQRPMIRGGAVVPRQIMNLSSSFDHRIVDGYDAAEFIQAIKALLEHPAMLFLG